MAWIFSLSAECGSERILAEQFSQHFENISLTLSDSKKSQCITRIFQDIDRNWWCSVCPSDSSEVGIETPESAYLMTEAGLLLYEMLRSAPPFRYALVGVEVDEFRTYDELIEDSHLNFPGLTLCDGIYQSLSSPPILKRFSQGYVWQPYQGEIYEPLTVSAKLKQQMDRLLALTQS